MTTACRERRVPLYRGLFPDWAGKRPFDFYLLENLLEARRESFFPTNCVGPDEDVNVYLAGMLARHLAGFGGAAKTLLRSGADPVLMPPAMGAPRATSAERYRLDADHRLFCQGIFGRGEILRRRRVPFGLTIEEAAARDRGVAISCYEAAACLLERGPRLPAGLVAVLHKLAHRYDDWVHVLGVLATRRLGMGARLSGEDLAGLTDPMGSAVPTLFAPSDTPDAPDAPDAQTHDIDPAALAMPDMDLLLDIISEYRRTRETTARERALAAAAALGVDPAHLPKLTAEA